MAIKNILLGCLPLLLVACKAGQPITLAQAEETCKTRLLKLQPQGRVESWKTGGIRESKVGFIWRDAVLKFPDDQGKTTTLFYTCEVLGKTDTSKVTVEQVASPE